CGTTTAHPQLQYGCNPAPAIQNSQASDVAICKTRAILMGEPSNTSNGPDQFSSLHGPVSVLPVHNGALLPSELQQRKHVLKQSSDMLAGPSTQQKRCKRARFTIEDAMPGVRSRSS